MTMDLEKMIRNVPDFPKTGILFRDITPLLLDPEAFSSVNDLFHARYADREFDKIASIESRGFIFGSVLAYRLGKGFIPLRKPGKLPWKTVKERYTLEYGEASLEMHLDAVDTGDRVVIVDDLLATGGTAAAAAKLIERRGGLVEEISFLVELGELGGRGRLDRWRIHSFMVF